MRELVDDVVNGKRSFHLATTETRVPFSMADVGG